LAEASDALTREKPGAALPPVEQLSLIADALIAQEDREFGGFGGAPKFPVSPALSFLQGEGASGNQPAAELVSRTLTTYASSDLRDAVEGGFFRYSTMRDFSEPHYERMLYDNAGLLSLYARAGDRDTAAGIVEFLRITLLVEGGFGSAQDSESVIEGQPSEGGYYLLDATRRKALTPPAVDDKVITEALITLAPGRDSITLDEFLDVMYQLLAQGTFRYEFPANVCENDDIVCSDRVVTVGWCHRHAKGNQN